MDNFEKYIRENATAFNDQKADHKKMWANITSQLNEEKNLVIPLWKQPAVRIAASLLLFFGLAFMFGKSYFNSNSTETNYVSNELLEIDMHYQSLIAHQVSLIQKNKNLSETDKKEFLSFMDELDKEYEILKKEIQQNLDNERVLEAIIANYKKRIELIENLLKKISNAKKTNDNYGYTL